MARLHPMSNIDMEKIQGLLYQIDGLVHFLAKCVASVPLTFLAIPLYTLSFLLLFIYRTFVVGVARCVGNSDLRRPLDLQSAVISHLQSPFQVTPSWVIVAMGVLEGAPDIGKLREQIKQKLFGKMDKNGNPFYPEARHTLEYFMGYPFFKQIPGLTVEQAVDKYVTFHKRTGGWDPSSFLDFTKTFAVKQFKEGGPLWEVAFLEKYTAPGSTEPHFAVVVRAQHSLTDGVGCLLLLQELGEKSSVNTALTRMNLPLSYRVYRTLSPIFRGGYDLLSFVLNWEVFASPNSIWPKSISPAPNFNPVGASEFSAAYSFGLVTRCSTLTSVRKVSKAWGVSGTVVIITAILRSVRYTLFPRKTILPTYMNMLLPLPSPEHNGNLTNAGILVNFLLPLYVENPITHAQEVDKEFQNVKTSSFPYVVERLTKLGGMMPNFFTERLLRSWRSTRPEYICFSTIIGPKEPYSICGHRNTEMSYLFPRADGFKFPMFQLISASDKMFLTVTADKSLIQDDAMAQRMVMAFHDEIENFQKVLTW